MFNARRIINTLRTPYLLYSVIKNIQRQKKFIKKNIDPQIDAAKKINDGSIDEADLKKISNYYGLAVPAILGEAFCALRGEKMTGKERLASTCQGATTGLFDDFFDKQNLSGEALKNFIENPKQLIGINTNQQLFLNLYTSGLQNLPDPQWTLGYVYQVYKAQVESKKQTSPGISQEEIKNITINKGGVSVLLYRTAFGNPLKPGEEKMLYCLGGLMQLSNDIFDLYPDLEQDIQTLATTTKDIRELRLYYSALLRIGYEAAYASAYPKKNIRQFLNIISISVFSRCFVCLDQLQKKQYRSNNIFTPHFYQRKELVCDMDTAGNKWRSVKYHIGIER